MWLRYEIYFCRGGMTWLSSWYEGVQRCNWEIWRQVFTSTSRYWRVLFCLILSFFQYFACLTLKNIECVGKFYLVDSGYPNRPGYLALYKGTKYHLPEYRQGPMPRGKKEQFNYAHSSLRNVIERSFRVLKMKWRILLDLPSYPMPKQSQIILACMALHNFIRDSFLGDTDFD